MSLADELLAVSEDESLAPELRDLLRRAVERISEAELDSEYVELIRQMNEAGQRPFGVNEVVKDWLIGSGRLPFEDIDEDTETKERIGRRRCEDVLRFGWRCPLLSPSVRLERKRLTARYPSPHLRIA